MPSPHLALPSPAMRSHCVPASLVAHSGLMSMEIRLFPAILDQDRRGRILRGVCEYLVRRPGLIQLVAGHCVAAIFSMSAEANTMRMNVLLRVLVVSEIHGFSLVGGAAPIMYLRKKQQAMARKSDP